MRLKIVKGWFLLSLLFPLAGTVSLLSRIFENYYLLINLLIGLVWIVSVFLYVFPRKGDYRMIWRIVGASWIIGLIIYSKTYFEAVGIGMMGNYSSLLLVVVVAVLLYLAFFIPVVYSLYRLSFPRKTIVKVKAHKRKKK